MTRTGQISRWSSIKRNLISAVPRRWPQPFLKCHAPSAADRSRDDAGKSPSPGPGRNAGPPPVSCAAPTPHPALRFHCANCAASRGDAQLACDPAQRATAAHQQGYRFPLELIRKMTPSLAHSTPFRSRRPAIHLTFGPRLIRCVCAGVARRLCNGRARGTGKIRRAADELKNFAARLGNCTGFLKKRIGVPLVTGVTSAVSGADAGKGPAFVPPGDHGSGVGARLTPAADAKSSSGWMRNGHQSRLGGLRARGDVDGKARRRDVMVRDRPEGDKMVRQPLPFHAAKRFGTQRGAASRSR